MFPHIVPNGHKTFHADPNTPAQHRQTHSPSHPEDIHNVSVQDDEGVSACDSTQ
jgi:hypothetical protein